MARGRKQTQADEAPGAPEWMVTFSDCMTLLLTFFVLLLSFSSFDKHILEQLSMVFFEGKPSAGEMQRGADDSSAFLPIRQIDSSQNTREGSEKLTLIPRSGDGLQEETDSADFYRQKVFLIPSKTIFWGRGTVVSSEGRSIMGTMASFLKKMPSRVVISENGPVDDENSRRFGLSRAWAVVEYLTRKHNLNRKWFSIAAASTLAGSPRSEVPRDDLTGNEPARTDTEPERTVEVVLLERSIYN